MLTPAARHLRLLLMALVLSACGGPDPSGAVQVGQAFEADLRAGDLGAACAALSAPARDDIQQDCSQLEELEPATGAPRAVVRGRMAVLHYADDTVFLSRGPDGWEVAAAGCRPRPGQPYSCDVDGG